MGRVLRGHGANRLPANDGRVGRHFYALGDPTVDDLRFGFDRDEYEAALAKLPNTKLTTEPWMESPTTQAQDRPVLRTRPGRVAPTCDI